ncbi:hypothetical protein MTR_2g437250 [Medicago truncatula]|uniref:Uncharacterized protein n=1 Tax=Medicago truncatula TaxID=3880 RepID=A0A072V658_MEDTR|nr:hypothetical protein MTR_2g437250 [Medicago truncatula]
MKIVDDRGYERVAFESDNQHVIHVVLSGCIYENDLGTIVSSCRLEPELVEAHRASFHEILCTRDVKLVARRRHGGRRESTSSVDSQLTQNYQATRQ